MSAQFSTELFNRVLAAGKPDASRSGVARRLLKNQEELGEVSEAYLALTDGINAKGKTPADLAEEVADVFLVTTDALQQFLAYRAQTHPGEARSMAESAREHLEGIEAIPGEEHFLNGYVALCERQGLAFELAHARDADHVKDIDTELGIQLMLMQTLAGTLLITAYPGMPYTSYEALQEGVRHTITRKIAKWIRVRAAGAQMAA